MDGWQQGCQMAGNQKLVAGCLEISVKGGCGPLWAVIPMMMMMPASNFIHQSVPRIMASESEAESSDIKDLTWLLTREDYLRKRVLLRLILKKLAKHFNFVLILCIVIRKT